MPSKVPEGRDHDGVSDAVWAEELSPLSSISSPLKMKMSISPRSSQQSESSEDEMFIFPLSLSDIGIHQHQSLANTNGHHLSLSPAASVKARRRTFSQPVVNKWKRVVQKVLSLDDPWTKFHLEDYPVELAIRHRYSAASKKWIQDHVEIRMEPVGFARGAMRECFRLKKKSKMAKEDWENCHNYVAKRYISDVEREVYFEDVRLQMDAKLWAEEYNRHNPPKKIDIFQVAILEFLNREGHPLYHLEHYIEGEYIKYNSNSGFVSEMYRKTPQAFSHFTFERSGHQLIVVDIQGVMDCYTDPQIHTADGKGYGDGNLGTKGMALFFHSHRCNDICDSMGLSKFDLSPTERAALNRMIGVPQVSEYCADVNTHAQRKMTTVCRNAISVCFSPDATSDPESAMDFVRTRSLSTASDDDMESGSFQSKISPRIRFGDVPEGREWYPDEESPMGSVDDCISGQFPGYAEIQLPTTPPARRRADSELDSITCSKEDEKQAFWEEMRKNSRPSCYNPLRPEEFKEIEDLVKERDVDAAHAVLGEVHLALARYHEVGRFSQHEQQSDGPAEYDRSAAWFHLEIAASCSVLEAITTMSHIYLGLPHELLADFTLEQDEDHVEEGLMLMQRAAELNDQAAVLFVAQAFDTGSACGAHVEPNWSESAKWYEKALEGLDATFVEGHSDYSVGGDSDAGMAMPKHTILARLAEMYREGKHGLSKDPTKAGDLFNEAAEAAMEAMKGKLANKYYMMAEEAYGEAEE